MVVMANLFITAYFQLPEQHRTKVLSMFSTAEVISTLVNEVPVVLRNDLSSGPLIASSGNDPADPHMVRLDVVRLEAESKIENETQAEQILTQFRRNLMALLAVYEPSWVDVRGYLSG